MRSQWTLKNVSNAHVLAIGHMHKQYSFISNMRSFGKPVVYCNAFKLAELIFSASFHGYTIVCTATNVGI